MSEDLTIGEEIEEAEFETTTRSDYVASCYNAIAAVGEIDTGIMSKEDAKRKARIVRKSLRIIDDIISELYDELFEEDEE